MLNTQTPVKVLVSIADSDLRGFVAPIIRQLNYDLLLPGDDEPLINVVSRHSPDVVILHIDDSPSRATIALSRLLVQNPIPVILMTCDRDKYENEIMRGLRLGAVDTLDIPSGYSDMSVLVRQRIGRKIAMNAGATIEQRSRLDVKSAVYDLKNVATQRPDEEKVKHVGGYYPEIEIAGIAISTGGPTALSQFVPRLDRDFPVPVLVVQHIIPGFLPGIISRLSSTSRIAVSAAEDGMDLLPGHVYFAPDGIHLKAARTAKGRLVARLDDEPRGVIFRPSGDELLTSIAEASPGHALGIIMTGMGRDGVEGIRAIRKSGGVTMAQDQRTSAVYGMPKVATDADLIDIVVSLDRIAAEMHRVVLSHNSVRNSDT